jgi:hypothetical protein
MKVKEIILMAAYELGLGAEMQEYYNSGTVGTTEQSELFLQCFNLVENELALDYLPLYAEDELETKTGVVNYALLQNSAVRILRVENEAGEAVKFDLYAEYLKTEPGVVKVQYTYTPKKKKVADESDFTLQASERLLSYGVASEYALATGRFEEAAVWEKKYKEAINAAYALRPAKKLRSRRWC